MTNIKLWNIKLRRAQEEREIVLLALVENKWNMRATAKYLGIAVSSLGRMIDRLALRYDYDQHKLVRGRPRKEP